MTPGLPPLLSKAQDATAKPQEPQKLPQMPLHSMSKSPLWPRQCLKLGWKEDVAPAKDYAAKNAGSSCGLVDRESASTVCLRRVEPQRLSW